MKCVENCEVMTSSTHSFEYSGVGWGYTHITLQTAVSMSTGGRGGVGLHTHHLTDCCEYVYWREGRGGVTHTSPYRLL